MRVTRRDLLRGGLVAAASLGLPGCGGVRRQPEIPPAPAPTAASKKRILILGGTGFLGPKTIDAAVVRGHAVTIFNRGKREKLLPLEHEVEHLYGNRDPDLPADDDRGPDGKLLHPDGSPKGLEQLAGRTWDVVIDNSGFYPRMVGASAKLLANSASRYIYISSISAYAEFPAAGGDEDTRLETLADPTVETMGARFENYGGLKVLCERAAADAFRDRAAIVRPGFIVGPGDPTDRFTYWPVRISRGGEALAPGTPDDPLQWIDVRDLAAWLVTLAERETVGTFNAIGPTTRWGDVLESCVAASTGAAKLAWVDADWLERDAGEEAFPIWAPPTGKYAGFHRWSNARARGAGITFRSVDDTVRALLGWYPGEVERRVRVAAQQRADAAGPRTPAAKGDPHALRAGPSREAEQALLAKWHARATAR